MSLDFQTVAVSESRDQYELSMHPAHSSHDLLPDSQDCMSPEMVEVYRQMSPTQRLQIAFGMWRSGKKLVEAAVKQQLPEASREEQQREVARRLSHGLL